MLKILYSTIDYVNGKTLSWFVVLNIFISVEHVFCFIFFSTVDFKAIKVIYSF